MPRGGLTTIESPVSRQEPAVTPIDALPAPVSSFIGREQELVELEGLLTQHRLVSLTGPGGSGKTRLAIELASRVAERLDQAATFVDLAPITDVSLVASTIAATLGIRADPGRPLLDTLVDGLASRPLLLLLDNVEQLLPAAATVVSDLLARCPGLRILATSRASLHLRGEHEYGVDPLALPTPADLGSLERVARTEAVALFVERAQAVERRFTLTDENRATIAEICRRLDGLPLAIELAAARSRLLAPGAILTRLEHRLALLTIGAVDAPARQQTLRDTLAWSYQLLDPADQRLFGRLSVFVGGFNVAAAEMVLKGPTIQSSLDLVEALGRLVDCNLLRVTPDREGEPRFTMLETIREFATDQLPDAEASVLRRRHAAHYMALAEAAKSNYGGPESPSWLRRATDDLDNIRAALVWASAAGETETLIHTALASRAFLVVRGDHREAGDWLRAAEGVADRAEPALRAKLFFEVARFELGYGGDRRRAERLFEASLRIDESLGNRIEMAWALVLLANMAVDLGDLPVAADRTRRALSVARTIEDRQARARLLGQISGHGRTHGRNLVEQKALAEDALHLGREIDDPYTVVMGLTSVGYVALSTGDAAVAVEALSEAMTLYEEFTPSLVAPAMAAYGIACLRAGEIERSRVLLADALARARQLDLIWIGLTALEGAADWLGAVLDATAAIVCWAAIDRQRAATLDRTQGDDAGLFLASRERDRLTLRAAAYETAMQTGMSMRLGDALDYATQRLDDALVDRSGHTTTAGLRRRYDLTPREHEVLELLAAGQTDGQIAEALFISKKTAAVHVANIKGKLGANSRVDIAILALRHGLVPGPSRT